MKAGEVATGLIRLLQRRRKTRTAETRVAALLFLLFLARLHGEGQMSQPPPGSLDPARHAMLQLPPQSRLQEEFVWTAGDAAARDPALQARVRGQDDKIAPHFFCTHFRVAVVPAEATVYLAGPRSAEVYLNGVRVLHASDDGTRPKNLTVLTASVAEALRRGDNVLAIEEVRGHSSLHTGASVVINQVTYGEVLVAKIVPRAVGVDAPPLVVSDGHWRSTLAAPAGWQNEAFDDSSWPAVESLGVIGSRRDFLQWNADAGLYAWPGYAGIGTRLRVFPVQPVALERTAVLSRLRNLDRLTDPRAAGRLFTVLPSADGDDAGSGKDQAASVTLDFGRELSGRLELRSASAQTQEVEVSYGESPEEADKDKGYLGVRTVIVPPHATAFGPKSAFRFVKLTFPESRAHSPSGSRWRMIGAEAITYPAQYLGSFESSDALVNRIWETAAYTARLCMQEGIWDGVKRDRGRWMGDLDVTGRTITSVFGERTLMEQTMAEIIGEPPVTRDINTISGYSALWITGQANFYRHTGDLTYLRRVEPQLLSLLQLMDTELDGDGLFTNPGRHKVFVDWSEGLSSDTPEARAATHFEFTLAYVEASYLLAEAGDAKDAARYRQQADRLRSVARSRLLDPVTGTFGNRWQTNAMAVLSGAAAGPTRQAIWQGVLAHVSDTMAHSGAIVAPVVTPYYGFYVLSAMAELGHPEAALQWMRQYWGGMLGEGATSFWEAYDPRWPKQDFHAFLEADNKKGYYVSLAHGWASGPAVWLLEQVLGIQPTAAGFREVTISPQLSGLSWAKGGEPTPRGLLLVDVRPNELHLTLPPGTCATVRLPFLAERDAIRQNGAPLGASAKVVNDRLEVVLSSPGEYVFAVQHS